MTTQSVVRRWRATRKLYIIRQIKAKEVDAATKIQATYVGFTDRKNYHIAVKRVVTCQCAIRTMIAKNKLQELVRHHSMCATTIQASWRRYFASKYFTFTLSEIVICQSVARRKIASMTYNELIAKREMAAVSIQKTYRRYREESMYIVFISDVTTTQTIARRWSSIRQLHMLRLIQTARKYSIATTIRAACVGYTARKNYLVVVKSVITLQCAGRKMMAKKLCQEIHKHHMCATLIQAVWRRRLASDYFTLIVSEVIVCQSAVRRKIATIRYNTLLARREMAAVIIQKSYRGFCDRLIFQTIVVDVITTQAIVRRWRAMRQIIILRQIQQAKEVDAATKIRATYVGYITRRTYLVFVNKVAQELRQASTKIKSAITIQATFRMYCSSKEVISMLSKVILCQSLIRGKTAMMRYNKLLVKREMAAVTIQRTYRGFSERELFHSIVADVVTTQSVARRWRATRKLYILKLIKRAKEVDAATKIQATYVGFTDRKNYHIAVKRVVTCQCAIRTMIAKNKLQELVRHRSMRATTIQASWRRYFASKHFMFTLLEIVICQSVARRKIASVTYNELIAKREMAAVSIQKTYRRYREASMYHVFISDVTTTQTIARRWSSIRQLHMLRLIRTAREYSAATTIRAAYDGYTARKNYLVVVKSVITLQCAGRKMMAKKLCREIQREMAAVRIQKSFRGFCERLKYQVTVAILVIQRFEEQFHAQKEWAAKRIQAAYRGYVTRCDYLITIADVITLQCAARTMIAKTEMFVRRQVQLAREDNAATKIRAAYVGYITRRHYLITIDCIVTCQCATRTKIARRRLNYAKSLKLTKELAAATKFQTAWRVYKAQVYYAKVIWAVMSIQNIFRCIKVKAKRASAAVIIQSEFRSYISCTGKHFFAANDVPASAQTSLSHFSFQIAIYQEYTAQRESTITIQSWLRMCAAVHERMRRMVLLSNVIKIQAVFRRHLAILRVNDIDRVCSIFEAENTMDVECVAVQERRGRVRMRNAWKDIILCGENYSNISAATAIVSEISCM
jgi:hypothetical protein